MRGSPAWCSSTSVRAPAPAPSAWRCDCLEAEVVAVDVPAERSLARVAAKAQAAGVGDRVRTLVADLDDGWPDLGPVDVTWASMSLHHLADPVRSLTGPVEIASPGGLLAVSEFDEPCGSCPTTSASVGPGSRPARSKRCPRFTRTPCPTSVRRGPTCSPRRAGPSSTATTSSSTSARLEHPLAGRYARAWFERLVDGLEGRLDPDDERTLAVLLDDDSPHGLLRRADLHLHGIRTLTIARR